MGADIFCQEPQHEIAIFLQEHVLAPVAAICLGVPDAVPRPARSQSATRNKQIHFHPAPAVERNRQLGIQTEPSGGIRQRFQAAIKKCLGRTPGTIGPFGIRFVRSRAT